MRVSEEAEGGREFEWWLWQVNRDWCWDWLHLAHTRDYLEQVTSGDIKRLMILEPPRHGKSEMVTVRYPAWRMEVDPTLDVIVGAYNQRHANRFSRKTRRIVRERVGLSDEQAALEEWRSASGATYRCVGVGAGVTGTGGDLIVIDDPVKGREEANSVAYRERCWEWYTNDLYTRLEPGGAIILIMTRWHEDDLAGRILQSEEADQWTVVKLPALAEEHDPLEREVGAALCADRFPVEELHRIRQAIGSWAFAALYQQSPLPMEGALAHREWFDVVDAAPKRAFRARAWDLAATEKETTSTDPDWLVGTKMARVGEMYWVEDVIHRRVGPGEAEKLILSAMRQDGVGVEIGIPQDPGSSGKAYAAMLERMLRVNGARRVHIMPTSGDKVVRASPFLAAAENGQVNLVRASWNNLWLDEVCTFPVGAHDDQVDSAGDAFKVLQNVRPPRQRVEMQWSKS